MGRLRTVHRCRACGAATARWAGRCPGCGEWNSLVEESEAPAPSPVRHGPVVSDFVPDPMTGPGAAIGTDRAVALHEVDPTQSGPVPTGLPELDRVLGGGLVP